MAAAMAVIAGSLSAAAQDFFDTSEPDQIFNLGVRIGVNTSNNTVDKKAYNIYNHNSWGTGFDLGVVGNINIRDYISLQPGFFFESRSGDFSYISALPDLAAGENNLRMDVGHTLRYSFVIPIMASVHFNISEDVRWDVEFGPYMAFNLKTNDDQTFLATDDYKGIDLRHKGTDFGFKMGSGITIRRHFVVAAHYMAGCCDAWKDPMRNGRNKGWVFTAGYDF